MKVDSRRIEAFLRDPGPCRAVLLYGDDVGLIRERAGQLVRAVAGATDDPFRVVELERDGFARIPEEMASIALTGGRRAIRVRDATDAATSFVEAALARPGDAVVVLEGTGIATKSRLRTLLERVPQGTAIGCYPQEGKALEQVIRDVLGGFGVSADADAINWLVGQLGADRAVTQREIEKVALYAGENGRVDLVAARHCVGDLAGLSLDDAVFAATTGDIAAADRALELAVAEGATPIGILRACLQHLQRMQRARAAISAGASPAEAMKSLRPPVFFRREAAFTAALRLWSPEALQAACVRLYDAERACKRTGAPQETISQSAVGGLAHRAAAARRR